MVREKRTNLVPVRLTDSELKILQRMADKRGLANSSMLRQTFLDYAHRTGESADPEAGKPLGR